MGKSKFDDVILFRCYKSEKMKLEEIARDNGMSLGELMRKGMKTIEVIFGDITIGDLIIMSDVLIEEKEKRKKSKG